MEFIDPHSIKIPRVYFTEFDRITFSQVERSNYEIKSIKKNLERKFKLLSLSKGIIVIATSHLFESELANEFIKENPIVLEEGILLPALISKYNSFSEFLYAKREGSKERELYLTKDKDEINLLLSNSVSSIVKWDVNLTSTFFKNRLLQDLFDERSVLRYNLLSVPNSQILEVRSKISEIENPSRGEIYKIGQQSGNKTLWMRLCDYTDFIYYLSGAHAVNSEGILPQENLIDFSLTDLENRKTKLSEYEIFYRIFINIIKDKTQKVFPIEILDFLSFKDIVELRKTLLFSGFVEKYNGLMEKTKKRIEIKDTEQLLLNIDELAQFENELHSIFTESVVKEINQLKKVNVQKKGLKVITNVGSLLTFYGTMESIIQLSINVLSLMGFNSQIKQTEEKIKHNLKRLEKMIDKSPIDNKPFLLNYLSGISSKYVSKLV
jgi:hypothetical protein